MDDGREYVPAYPALARGRLTHEEGQQFPTSTFRDYDEGPNGWDYLDVLSWGTLDPNLWFVPWCNVHIAQSKDELLAASTTALESGPPKLVLVQREYLDDKDMGTGIVIQADGFAIVGCYKTHKDADTEYHRNTENESCKSRLELEDVSREMSSLGADERARRRNLQRKYDALDRQIRRRAALLRDPRPAKIARHEPVVFEIGWEWMEGEELGEFGMRYLDLHERFQEMVGELYREREDSNILVRSLREAAKDVAEPMSRRPCGKAGFVVEDGEEERNGATSANLRTRRRQGRKNERDTAPEYMISRR